MARLGLSLSDAPKFPDHHLRAQSGSSGRPNFQEFLESWALQFWLKVEIFSAPRASDSTYKDLGWGGVAAVGGEVGTGAAVGWGTGKSPHLTQISPLVSSPCPSSVAFLPPYPTSGQNEWGCECPHFGGIIDIGPTGQR